LEQEEDRKEGDLQAGGLKIEGLTRAPLC